MNEKEEKIYEAYESIINLEKCLEEEASEKEKYIIDLMFHLLYDLKSEMKKKD